MSLITIFAIGAVVGGSAKWVYDEWLADSSVAADLNSGGAALFDRTKTLGNSVVDSTKSQYEAAKERLSREDSAETTDAESSEADESTESATDDAAETSEAAPSLLERGKEWGGAIANSAQAQVDNVKGRLSREDSAESEDASDKPSLLDRSKAWTGSVADMTKSRIDQVKGSFTDSDAAEADAAEVVEDVASDAVEDVADDSAEA